MKKINNDQSCNVQDVATKSFFLGPKAENADWLRRQILYVLDHFFQWRKDYNPEDGFAISRYDQKNEYFIEQQQEIEKHLAELCQRFEKELPFFSPRYIGHMNSELSLPSILGQFIAALHNPNIISSESSRVGAFLEEEAIKELATMLFYDKDIAQGHFTSGGTVANIEALWRARYSNDHFLAMGTYLNIHHQLKLSYFESCQMGWKKFYEYLSQFSIKENDLKEYSYVYNGPWKIQETYRKAFGRDFKGPAVLVPNSKHYSWLKGVSLLGLGDVNFVGVKLSENGSVSLADLEEKIESLQKEDIPIMMNVSILGSTELGKCDDVHAINNLLQKYKEKNIHIWHHVDAAYGGYFASTIKRDNPSESILSPEIVNAYMGLKDVQSITIDPHKLGYIPYACGAIITQDMDHYKVSAFEAKYLQSPDKVVDRWMKTLEGSRSAQGATATWLTNKSIGLTPEGYGLILSRTVRARISLNEIIKQNCPDIHTLEGSDLNLLCLVSTKDCKKLSEVNAKTESLIKMINESREFTVSKTILKCPEYECMIEHHCNIWGIEKDANELSLLRLTIMNPFFLNKETNVSYLEVFSDLLNQLQK